MFRFSVLLTMLYFFLLKWLAMDEDIVIFMCNQRTHSTLPCIRWNYRSQVFCVKHVVSIVGWRRVNVDRRSAPIRHGRHCGWMGQSADDDAHPSYWWARLMTKLFKLWQLSLSYGWHFVIKSSIFIASHYFNVCGKLEPFSGSGFGRRALWLCGTRFNWRWF